MMRDLDVHFFVFSIFHHGFHTQKIPKNYQVYKFFSEFLMNLLALDHFYSSANSPIFLVNGRFQSIFCGRAVMKNCQIEKNKVPLMQPKSNGDVIFSD